MMPAHTSAMSNAGYSVNRLLAIQGGATGTNTFYATNTVLGSGNDAGLLVNASYSSRGGFISTQTSSGIALSLVPNQTINEDTTTNPNTFTISGSVIDQANWTLTATSSNTALLPVANILLNGSGTTRTVTATPVANGFGTAIVTVTATDGLTTAESRFKLTVNPVNDAPIAANGAFTTNEDTGYTGTLSASDVDGDPLTYSLVTPPAKGVVTINATTGVFSYTPNLNANGSDSFTFKASDSSLAFNTATMAITINPINDAPTISGVPATGVAERTPYSFIPIALDVDGNTLTFSISNKPAWATFDTATGVLTGTPEYSDQGSYPNILISVSDNTLNASLSAFSIIVTDTSAMPTISDIPNQSSTEDSTLGPIAFTVGDLDTPLANLIVAATSSNAELIPADNSHLILGGSGAIRTLTIKPAANKNGLAVITVTVNDGVLSVSDTFTVTVTPVNDLPTISGIPATKATPGVAYSFTPVASDIDGDALSFSITNKPAWASFNTATGVLSGTPTPTDFGTYSGIVISVISGSGLDTVALPAFALSVEDITNPVAIDVLDGTFKIIQNVTLTCQDDGSGCAAIYYTLDGGVPTTNSTRYTGPITLSANTILKYIAIDNSGRASEVRIKNFVIDTTPPQIAITDPADGLSLNELFEIIGTAADQGGTGIDTVRLQITDGINYVKELSPGVQVFTKTPSWVNALTGDQWVNWNFYTTVSWTLGKTYSITVRATDKAGNVTDKAIMFAYSADGGKAFTQMSIELSSQAVLQGKTLDVTGQLTRLPVTAMSLAGREITLKVIDPNGITVTTTKSNTSDQNGHFLFREVSGFNQKGRYTLEASFTETALLAGSKISSSVLVGQSAGYAVIVEGRITNNEGLASHNKTANRIYQQLLSRGFEKEKIFYFNHDTTQTGVDANPTKAVVEQVISGTHPTFQLASLINGSPAPVYIIMVDHGQTDKFYLNGDTETISPTELNSWLTTLESKLTPSVQQNEKRIVILGACYSGSFVPVLSKLGRVVISSAAAGEESYKGPQEPDGVRVGEYFLEVLFKELERGKTLAKAFQSSVTHTGVFTRSGGNSANSLNTFFDNAMQHPLLDDNGDRKGNNQLTADTSGDGSVAGGLYLGTGVSYATNSLLNPAEVTSVTGTLYLASTQDSATLWAKANDDSEVQSAWIEIRPPSKTLTATGSKEQVEVNLEKFLLDPPVNGHWNVTLTGKFLESGLYEIYYFMRDKVTGDISPMMRSLVYKQKAVNAAPTAFSLLTPVTDTKTKTVAVFNWNASIDPDGGPVTYNLLIASDSAFTNVVYRKEEIQTSAAFVDDEAKLADLTTYYWKVQAVDAYGAVTNSSETWRFSTDNTNGNNGIIYGLVMSDRDFSRIAGALLTVNNIQVATKADGSFILETNAGTVGLLGSHADFQGITLPSLEIKAGQSSRVNITLHSLASDIPTATNGTFVTVEEATYTGTLSATASNGHALTYSLVSYPTKGSVTMTETTGAFFYTPNLNATGADAFTFKVTDGTVSSNTATMTITITPVNDVPIATIGAFATNEDTAYAGTLSAVDVDGDALTYSLVTQPSKGVVSITNATTGKFTYTPTLNANGSDSFTFKVKDGTEFSNTATMTVTINAINDAPVAQNSTLNINEDTVATGTLGASDVDGDILTYSIVSNGSKGVATITNAATGAYRYTPNANINGTDSFTFKVTDSTLNSNVATISVSINSLNDAPVALDDTFVVTEDTATTGLLPSFNPDIHSITFTILQNGTKGVITLINASIGTYSYTPKANITGTDSFTFKVNNGVVDSNTATITVTINPVNDAPVGSNGSISINKNMIGTSVLSASDIDSNSLTYSIVTNGTKGSAVITNALSGAFSYTPNANATGTDTFTFKVNDGLLDSNLSTITVTINDVVNAPIANNGLLHVDEDVTATGTLLVTNVSEGSLTYSIVSNGSKGTATITNAQTGTFSYTPNANANGTDTFTFQAFDGTVNSNSATITVIIHAINDAPVAMDGTLSTNENTMASGSLRATDVDGDNLIYTIVSNGAKGVATISNTSTGAYNYTPNSGTNGTDTFTFKVNDGQVDSNIATITVTINAAHVNTKPSISPIANQTVKASQTPINVPLTVSDHETASDQLIISTKSLNTDLIPDANIQVVFNGTQPKLVITPIASKTGGADIVVTVGDGTYVATVNFNVTIWSETPIVSKKQISGVLKNAAGNGVANVLVRLQPEFDPETGSIGTWAETLTDANGNYSFNVLIGKYRIEFLTSYQKDGAKVTVAGNLVGGFANGSGGTINDWDDASVLQLTDATEINATLATGVTLSGTVKLIGEIAVPGAEVNIHSKDWSVFFHAKTNAQGAFSVMVNPGLEYQVDVWPAYCETDNTNAGQGCGVGQAIFQGGTWITPQDAIWVSGWSANDNTTQPMILSGNVTTGTDVFGTVMALSDDHMVTNIKMDQSLAIRVLVDSGIQIQGRVVDGANAGVPYAWVDTPFGGGPTQLDGSFTINLPSAGVSTTGLATFTVQISPSGHVDPDTHAWVQGTGFIGGVVKGDAIHGFSLSDDETQAAQFTPAATAWPAMDLLSNGSKNGLLVRVSDGISITGTVANSTQGLANLWVNVWSSDIDFGAGASTNSNGTYTIKVPTPATNTTVWYELNLWSDRYLVPESRLVKVQSTGVVGVYQIDKTRFTEESTGIFKPVAGAVIENGTNFVLETGKTISGRVVNTSNQGMPWTWVDIHSKDGTKWYGANTDENGYYSLTVAPANNYIGVVWGGNGQYRTTFYKNVGKEEDATLINALNGNVTDVNFLLGSGTKISGTITGLATGKKVWVNAWSEQENIMGGVEVTGSGGSTPVSFAISGLGPASDYRLDWRSVSEEIPGGYYGGVLGGAATGPKSWEQATLLSTLNGNVTGVAIDLTPPITKTLHIKIDGLDGVSLVNANVRSDKLDKGRWKQATVVSETATIALSGLDANGEDYQLFIGSPNATFKVGNFLGTVSNSAYPTISGTLVGLDRATLINMASDQYVYVKVSSGRQLTVTVAGLSSGQKAWVDAYSETTGAWGGGEVKYGNGTTDKVVIKGLESADDYRISVWGEAIQGGSYAGTDQNGNPKSPGSWETAELVDLSSGNAAISMTVSSGRSISGTVSQLKNKELAWVEAWSNSTFSWGGKSVQAAGSGSDTYTITGVGQAADFKVNFNAHGYLPQSQSGVNTTTQNASGVNFTATTGGSITGSITGLNGFEWVRMDAWSPGGDHFIVGGVSANAQGAATYTLSGVPAASDYVVGLWRGDKGLFYATSGVTPVWDNHSNVTVTGSDVTRSIDFDLTAANNLFFTLSGSVSGLSADQVVEIRAWSETAGASTTITGNGSFKLEGLPSGNYTVEVTSNGYAPQHTSSVTVSNGVVSNVVWSTGWNNKGTVAVTANTTGLNIVLSKGYSMKGTVTNNSTAVSGIWVNAWSETDHVGGGAITNSKGEFTIKGLPNLTYKVDVWTPDGTASKDVTMNGVNQTGVTLAITKAGGSITGNVTTSAGDVAGEAMVLAYDNQGTEKQRAISNPATGAYILDGLNTGESYTVKVFSAAKFKAGNWSTDTGYATGSATATAGGVALNLKLN